MTLKQLKFLLAIVDNGLNISAAAERLYTSQPGISKQLKLLEDELGAPIFERKGKALVAVTPTGEQVLARARVILREVDNIRTLASNLAREETGTLSIATTNTQARYVLPDVIRTFRRRYPRVNLEMHQGTSEQIAELMGSERIDFAIATGSYDLFPGLVMLPCYQWDRIILAPKEHPVAQLDHQVTLADLAEHPLVTYVYSGVGESSFHDAFSAHKLEPEVVFTARDADVIKTYVRMGLGVGVLASMAYECSDADDLAAIDASPLFPSVTTWLGFRRDSVLRTYMAEFIQMFASHLTLERIDQAMQTNNQLEVDGLFKDVELPLRTGCTEASQTRATASD